MRLAIDHRAVDLEQVTYNDGMGFGRFDSDTIAVHSYQLFVERADLIRELTEKYRSVCEEIRLDDEQFGGETPFMSMGYCGLDDAFGFPAELAEAIRTYLILDVLGACIPWREHYTFVVNSVDRITVAEDGILLEGRCFRRLKKLESWRERVVSSCQSLWSKFPSSARG